MFCWDRQTDRQTESEQTDRQKVRQTDKKKERWGGREEKRGQEIEVERDAPKLNTEKKITFHSANWQLATLFWSQPIVWERLR